MAKTLVIITSYNRKDSVHLLVCNLLEKNDCDVLVYDDRSDKEIAEDLASLKCTHADRKRFQLILSADHRGKAGFWQTYQDIFNYCKSHEYDYYIILPDDVEPCPNFVEECIKAYDKAGCICLSPLLTNRSLLPGISRWGRKPIIRKDWGYLTSYFDCCTICRRDFFEALNW